MGQLELSAKEALEIARKWKRDPNPCSLAAEFDEVFFGTENIEVLLGALSAEYSTPDSQYDLLSLLGSSKALELKDCGGIAAVGSYYYALSGGGIESTLASTSHALSSLGIRSIVIANALDGSPSPDCLSLDLASLSTLPDLERSIARFQRLRSALVQSRTDALIHHAWFDTNLLWDLLLCKKLGIRFLLYVHGVFSHFLCVSDGDSHAWNDGRLFASVPALCKYADGVICGAQPSALFFSFFNHNAVFIPNATPASLSKVEKRLSPPSEDVLLWVGRFDIFKRPEEALRIAKLVFDSRPNARLVYVGASGYETYEEELCETARELGIADRVQLCGYQDDTAPYYQEASVLLLTTEVEGFCMVLLEASAFGVPAVAYELPYLPFADNKGISWVPQGNAELAAKAVVELLESKEAYMERSGQMRSFFDEYHATSSQREWASLLDRVEHPDEKANPSPKASEMMWDTLFRHYLTGYQRTAARREELLQQQIRQQEQREEALAATVRQEYESSPSYRIGRILTAAPRKLRDLLTRHNA
ncbi:glycosyltransferase family 4 protein [Adlercreutzia sp. ZJ242]|uniref:glycosyltransferase family 4 protein n=1 Tax=Adlercreutzia sp. ZJ242 TaxID=2709409 RepID=UPI0013EDF29D|nr:glycosyltransferase family 4 protein [Adlercreutzia sp. ZJ242]